ncbi:MAG: glycosyltransferase family 2 protein [Lachnospiraceae bacterium]|nr:glycosyltransferase family 2 protein [Lachnospiraceae bacterium]
MVSIIIPMYNSEKYILDALRSALVQKVEKEIIVIDDCSTDNSLRTVLDFIKKKHNILDDKTRILVRKNSKNLGVAKTRNLGVAIARGEYVAYLDADDMWTSGKLARQLEIIERADADICNTSREIVDEDGISRDIVIGCDKLYITLEDMEKTNYINCSSVLAKREIMLKYPMKHDRKAHEDYYTWLMMLKDGVKICNTNEPLLRYRDVRDGKSHNKLKAAAMTFKTYKYAGYGIVKAISMMPSYIIRGVKKHKNL